MRKGRNQRYFSRQSRRSSSSVARRPENSIKTRGGDTNESVCARVFIHGRRTGRSGESVVAVDDDRKNGDYGERGGSSASAAAAAVETKKSKNTSCVCSNRARAIACVMCGAIEFGRLSVVVSLVISSLVSGSQRRWL